MQFNGPPSCLLVVVATHVQHLFAQANDSSTNTIRVKIGSKVNFIYNINRQDRYRRSTSYRGT